MQATTLVGRVGSDAKDLSGLLTQLWNDVSWRDLRTGKWFTKLLTHYVAHYEATHDQSQVAIGDLAERERYAHKLIDRTAIWAALAGAGSAGIVTAASLSTAQTAGAAIPLVAPVAAASMVVELVARSLLHLGMSCHLAAISGVRFPPGSEAELVKLYALAVEAEAHETETDPGRGLVERVVQLQKSGDLGKLVAARIVSESLLRNIVPVADIFVSSFRNFQVTREVGDFMHGYVSRQSRIAGAVDRLRARNPESVDLLLEGLWFLFIADGRLTAIETALLTHLLQRQGSEAITPRFVSDEASWLERVRASAGDQETRRAFWQALADAAQAHAGNAVETPLLQSLARTLDIPPEARQSTAA